MLKSVQPSGGRRGFSVGEGKRIFSRFIFTEIIQTRRASGNGRFFVALSGALHHGKAENNKRINIRKIMNKIQNILSRLRRELKKRKQKPKNSKSGLDTGGGML